jgi:hypothetical protein
MWQMIFLFLLGLGFTAAAAATIADYATSNSPTSPSGNTTASVSAAPEIHARGLAGTSVLLAGGALLIAGGPQRRKDATPAERA